MANGSQHDIYAVKETVYGETPVSPALDTVRITGTTLGLDKDSLTSAELRSDRQIADFRLGANQVGGDINFELSYGSFDEFLQGVLLSEDWAGAPEEIKAGVTRSSFTFIREFSDLGAGSKPFYIYRGCELNTLSLTVNANAMITGAFGIVGQSQEIASDLSGLTTPTFNPPTTTKPLDSFTGSLLVDSVENAVVTEMSLSLDNAIAPRFVVGDKNTIRSSVGRSNLTGSVSAYFEDSSLIETFLNETEVSLEFTLPDLAGNLQTYTVPKILFTAGKPDVTDEGPVIVSLPFQAILDPVTGTNLVITRTPV